MRDLKFRAWDKELKRWVPIKNSEWKNDLKDGFPYLVGEIVYDGQTKDGRDLVNFKGGKTTFITFGGKIVDVYPYGGKSDKTYIRDISKRFILTQYTGLHDKNRKEIYEGDILKVRSGMLEVIFEGGAFILANDNYSISNTMFYFIREMCVVFEKETEIIGNIYENPNLLNDNCGSK